MKAFPPNDSTSKIAGVWLHSTLLRACPELDEGTGLNWLCFFAAFIFQNLHKLLLLLTLRQFARLVNWLCFLNHVLLNVPWDLSFRAHSSCLGFSIQCFKLPAKGRRLALNWLCFFAVSICKNLHKSLLLLILRHFTPPPNWLCFFKFTHSHKATKAQRSKGTK